MASCPTRTGDRAVEAAPRNHSHEAHVSVARRDPRNQVPEPRTPDIRAAPMDKRDIDTLKNKPVTDYLGESLNPGAFVELV